MREEIIEHIKKLEKDRQIKILLAVESGSRAWGCPSPDSDFDVRIIFKRDKSEYLKIDQKKDTIDYFHGELLDINGWDIKKVLKLIRKSNATPFEWVQSPIKYKEIDNCSSEFLDLSKRYFQPRHAVNHYIGIAKNSYLKKDSPQEIKLKKLFYVLRPLMAAKWIILKDEVPPMDIPNLIKVITDQNIVDHIHDLLELKRIANEDYVHNVDTLISDYIKNEFDEISSIEIIDREVPSTDSLNEAFLRFIED